MDKPFGNISLEIAEAMGDLALATSKLTHAIKNEQRLSKLDFDVTDQVDKLEKIYDRLHYHLRVRKII